MPVYKMTHYQKCGENLLDGRSHYCSAANRDPRIDPQAGDVILQPNGTVVTVTSRCVDKVSWRWRSQSGRSSGKSSWSLRGWVKDVALGSSVVSVGDA